MRRQDDWGREVKVFLFVVPRATVDGQAFAQAWRRLPTPTLPGLRRYVHVVPAAGGGEAAAWCFGAPFAGGVAELWFDSVAVWLKQEPALLAQLDAGAGQVADLAATRWLVTRENPVVLGPELAREAAVVKASFHITRTPGMGLEQFQRHWRTTHAEIAACDPGTPKLLRYVQCHVLPEAYADPGGSSPRKRHPAGAPYDGVAELWWRTEDDLEAALASPAFQHFQPDDAARFIDGATNFGFVSREDRRIWP